MRNPIGLLVLALLFVPLERLLPLRRERIFRPGWRTDVLHFFFSHALEQLLLFAAIALLAWALHPLVPARLQAGVAAQPRALQLVEAFLLVELIGYFAHRAFHRVPWLWRIHAVHHSSEHLDWLASLRVHPFDQLLTRALQFIPLYLLGFRAELFAGVAGGLGLYALLLHANARVRLGPLEALVSSPRFHHWHHSADAEGRDVNFAGLFPWVDRLFGTHHLPPERWPGRYGSDTEVPASYLRQLAYPLPGLLGGGTFLRRPLFGSPRPPRAYTRGPP